jgi:hypothetical protein
MGVTAAVTGSVITGDFDNAVEALGPAVRFG